MIEKPDKVQCNSQFMNCPCLFSQFFPQQQQQQRVCGTKPQAAVFIQPRLHHTRSANSDFCHGCGRRVSPVRNEAEKADCVFPTWSPSETKPVEAQGGISFLFVCFLPSSSSSSSCTSHPFRMYSRPPFFFSFSTISSTTKVALGLSPPDGDD